MNAAQIAETILQAMVDQDLSYSKAATQTGVAKSMLNEIVNRKRTRFSDPQMIKTLRKIAAGLGLPENTFDPDPNDLPVDLLPAVGQFVRRLRIGRGWSQSEIPGIDQTTISRIETDPTYHIGPSVRILLSQAFGVPTYVIVRVSRGDMTVDDALQQVAPPTPVVDDNQRWYTASKQLRERIESDV